MPNCPQTMIAVYAVAKLGAICNMVHALLPADNLRANMEFTDSTVLITGNHADDCKSITFADKLLYVDISKDMGVVNRFGYKLLNRNAAPRFSIPFERGGNNPICECPNPASLADSCALYMHSSGSTGEPKTVMLSHAALNRWVEITKFYFAGSDISEQICLSALPYFHALGFQMDMHRVISCGGTLVQMAKWDGKKAVRFIKRHKVTVMGAVPAMCRSLLNRKEFSGPGIMQLRTWFIGGEKMDSALKQELELRMRSGDDPCVFEGYGLTETGSACAVLGKKHYHIDSCGYPLHGIQFMVRQEDGSLYPTGEGELIVGGNCFMSGYLKDPVATEEAFIEWDGQRMLRTGDYGRIDRDGLIYFIDRLKNTIVRKGNNIFPVEVESAIRPVDGVEDVCVIGLPDVVKETQLVCACIVPRKGLNEDTLQKEVEAACKRALPPVSRPSRYVFLQELPKTQIGKLDRKALEQRVS